jgi:hypothetical protein
MSGVVENTADYGNAVYNNSTGAIITYDKYSSDYWPCVLAKNGYAVYKNNTGITNLTGTYGLVFAYGTTITDVIYGEYTTTSGSAVIAAWDKAAGINTYTAFTSYNIFKSPETATAMWLNQSGKAGISVASDDRRSYFFALDVTVDKIQISVPTINDTSFVYNGGLQSVGITWWHPEYTISGGSKINAGNYTARVHLKTDNCEWALPSHYFDLNWSIAKADPEYTNPMDLTVKVGQTLADVIPALSGGLSWMEPMSPVGETGTRTHLAKFTPFDTANYNILENIPIDITVLADTPIRDIQKSDGRYGIKLSNSIVSDKAEFTAALPNDKAVEVKAVIYDNTGNVVFEKTERGAKLSWNLTNGAGRSVVNGTYLVVAQVRGAKGTYAYSAKIGVKK